MKVLIISPCGPLPVPAVKGGAVLTLIDSLINQNEIYKELNITVVSSFDYDAYEESKKYNNSSFIFIKKIRLIEFLDAIYEKLYFLITKKKHNTDKRYFWKLHIINQLKKTLRKGDYDKVVFENSGFLLKTLKDKKIQKKYKSKLYYHLHNDIPDNIDMASLEKCTVLSISNYLKKKIDRLVDNKFTYRFELLRNGFDCEKFAQNLSNKDKQNLRDELGIKNNDKVIIFTGRITQEKGILELVTAFEQLNNENLKLVVIGSHRFGDSQRSRFLEIMEEKFKKMADKVIFTGYIPYSEIWKYYKIADLAVLPSTWEEPAGLTMLEATAASVPLITTYSGGIPEYLSKNQVHFVKNDSDLSNHLIKTINDFLLHEDEYRKTARKASEFVLENYSEKKYYYDFVKIIKKGS